MTASSFDPLKFKEHERRDWDRVAAGWEAWWPVFEEGAQGLSRHMLDLAEVGLGHRVLDIGTGFGEPALTAALRVGPTGSVVGTDLSPAMLDVAKRRATEQGLGNIEFREMDAEALDFPGQSFDAVVCRWGLMFFADMNQVLVRARELLKPGGRFVAAVWGPADRVPLVSVTMSILRPAVDIPPPAPGTPDMFRLADMAVLENTIAEAGFESVQTESVWVDFHWPSAEDYTRFRQDTAAVTVALLQQCPPERKTEVLAGITDAARAYADDSGRVKMANESLCVVALK